MFSVRKTNPSKFLYFRGWLRHEPTGYWVVVDKVDQAYFENGLFSIYSRKDHAQCKANQLNNSIKVKEFRHEVI